MSPPGKNSGLTTRLGGEGHPGPSRALSCGGSVAGQQRRSAKCRQNSPSIRSPIILPPPPWATRRARCSGMGHSGPETRSAIRRSGHRMPFSWWSAVIRTPPIPIVGRAGTFGRDHRGAQRTLRRAADAEGRAVVRLQPLQHLAGDALRRLLGWMSPRRSAARRRMPQASRRRQPLSGITPIPRHGAVAASKTCSIDLLCRPVALPGHRPGIGVFHLRLAPLRACCTVCRMPCAHVQRLETGDHDRHADTVRPSADTPSSPSPRRHGRPPGSPAPGCAGEPRMACIAGGTSTWETSTREVLQPERLRLSDTPWHWPAPWSRTRWRRRPPAGRGSRAPA